MKTKFLKRQMLFLSWQSVSFTEKYIPWISQIQTSLLLINPIGFKIFKNFPGVPQRLLTHHRLTYFIYFPSSSSTISTCLLAPPNAQVPGMRRVRRPGPPALHRPGGKASPRDHAGQVCSEAGRHAACGAHRTPPGCGLAWAWAPLRAQQTCSCGHV